VDPADDPSIPHPDAWHLLGLVAELEPGILIAGPIGRPRRDAATPHTRTPHTRTPHAGQAPGPGALFIRPLRPGGRASTTDLFGLLAPPGTQAVALALTGRADTDAAPHRVRVEVAVDADGRSRSRVRSAADGHVLVEDDDASGLLVDALHRVLGLAAPGPPPPFGRLVLGVWCAGLAAALRAGGPLTWPRAAALHPAVSSHPSTSPLEHPPPSPESIAEWTTAVDAPSRWESLRRRVATGSHVVDLRPSDADWMDATTFGRWYLGGLPSPEWLEGELLANRAPALAGFREVRRRCR